MTHSAFTTPEFCLPLVVLSAFTASAKADGPGYEGTSRIGNSRIVSLISAEGLVSTHFDEVNDRQARIRGHATLQRSRSFGHRLADAPHVQDRCCRKDRTVGF
jgi:hypothetical protein